MRIVYMGTPDFAVPCLERILSDGHEVVGVFTQPDRPRGRGYQLFAPPVKQAAEAHGVPVYQPETLKGEQAASLIAGLKPDAIVVTAYGKILPESVLNIPPLGCINVHASLLPKYRGAAPMQWALINGETVTGVTTMYMAKGIDTGDMILSRELPIGENETFGELHDAMKELGAQLLSETLRLLGEGKAPRLKQDDALSCYAPMIDKTTARIDFAKPAKEVHNLVRGLSPAPGAAALFRGRPVKIYQTVLSGAEISGKAGDAAPYEGGIAVLCGDGRAVTVLEIQEQGSKRMPAKDYLRGHPLHPGDRFERISN